MKKEKTAPFALLQIALNINKSNLEKIDWMEEFINYIEKNNTTLYKEAREYADNLEENDYWTEEEKKKWGMTEDEIQDVEVTCCNVEITQEIKEVGLCPKCLEHI